MRPMRSLRSRTAATLCPGAHMRLRHTQPMESSGSAPSAASGDASRGKRDQTRRITIIALCLLAGVFALLNLDEVKVNFLVTTTRAPLIIVIVACLAVGLALGLVAGRKRGE